MTEQESKSKKRAGKRRSDERAVWQAFVACSRCSYFLAGYDLIHDDIESAVKHGDGKWLNLTWSTSTRKLVQKSYGITIRQGDSSLEGICPDCRRIYGFSTLEGAPTQETFRIKINPSP